MAGAVRHRHAVAHARVDVVVHVAGLHVEEVGRDAAEVGDRGGPGAELAAIEAEGVGLGREQRSAGADVGAALGLHGLDADAGQLGAAGQAIAAQGHHAEGLGLALELDLALDHLPLALDVADRLQQLRGHAELVGGVGELAVDAAQLEAGVVGRGIERLGLLDAGLGGLVGIDDRGGVARGPRVAVAVAVITARGQERERGEEAQEGGAGQVGRTLHDQDPHRWRDGATFCSYGRCAPARKRACAARAHGHRRDRKGSGRYSLVHGTARHGTARHGTARRSDASSVGPRGA
ncbi:MAG: hypothetical protein IPO88_08720 [Nannocystis sp.]|uniref:hypothetical protein n=1 Tax=Nannocystis sp. TaxID=1962667 RepID=UPI0024274407|nr:hypothetical protein [Nannocystis sp.]MBK9753575.1 hypothetical protein [Nannocystis sp.]